MKIDTKKMIITAMLIATSAVIAISFPKLPLPQPMTATLAFHVPQIIAIFLGYIPAASVAVGSSLAFLIALPNPIVAIRALTHLVFSTLAVFLLKKGVNKYLVLILVAPVHALLESLAVLIFMPGSSAYFVIVVTGVVTLGHHLVDCLIALPILEALKSSRLVPLIGYNQKPR